MKRKLWLLNFLLIAAIWAGVWRLRRDSSEFHRRERLELQQKVAAPRLPAAALAPTSPSVNASSYIDIAQKTLFSKDRNPDVIVDPPKPPDPPKPLPPLPVVSGVMDIGDGPIGVMSERQNATSRGIRPGDTIGEFKLVAVNGDAITLSWQDRTVTKKVQDLIDRGVADAGAAAATPGTTTSSAPPPPPPVVGKAEPGVKLSEEVSSCQTNDPSPAGTVVNGMRKVVSQTPFGAACRWEAVK